MFNVGFSGLFRGDVRRDIGTSGRDGGFLCLNIRLRLHILYGRDHLAPLYVVAFLHVEVSNAAKRRSRRR